MSTEAAPQPEVAPQPDSEPPPCGPATYGSLDADWRAALAGLPDIADGSVAVQRGWDLDWEREQWEKAAAAGRGHLSVRLLADEVLIGPWWAPGTDSGCAACAELRARTILEHPLVGDLSQACSRPGASAALLPGLLDAAVSHLVGRPLRPGELYAVGSRGARRHRVPRSFQCPVCGPTPAETDAVAEPPGKLVLRHRPTTASDPTRGTDGKPLLDRLRVRDRLVDSRFGPVQGILRESHVPFAMSMAVVPDAPAMGHGRAQTFAETEPVAVLECYERLGGFPFDTPVLRDVSYSDVAAQAVDPFALGRYTQEQLDHPTCRVKPFDAGTPMDWVWGHDLASGEPLLVPADVGFYQYEYRFRRDRRAARAAGRREREHYFFESSSGCAVGATREEAALHSLFELAERDAFLLSWYGAKPLPYIPESTITDPTSRDMIDLIHANGFDVHLLVATQDIALPVVWVLAVNRENPFPATFSSAGSGADPASAVRGALREVAQLVTNPVDWERADVEKMVEDPWIVEDLEQHVHYSSIPETRDRALVALGGPRTTLEEAFPRWPERVREAAQGDVRQTLRFVQGLFEGAGLEQIVLVDQTSREHADAGISVARAVVPGILPMTFGSAQLRLAGIPRLEAATRGMPREDDRVPYVPHPFP